MQGSNQRSIVIGTWPLSIPAEKSFMTIKEDPVLEAHIIEHAKGLGPGIEVFERRHNIIVTEAGYFGAFYSDQVELLPD